MTQIAGNAPIAVATHAKSAITTWALWTLVALLVVALSATIRATPERLLVLRALLLLLAAGEAGGAVSQAFFAPRAGGPELPAFRVTQQDFALYNAAMSALFLMAATDPPRWMPLVNVTTVLYAAHGATHVLRYAGVLARRPERPIEIRQGLPLLTAALGLLLFHP